MQQHGQAAVAALPSTLIVVPTLGHRPDLLNASLDSLLEQAPPMSIVVVCPASAAHAVGALVGPSITTITQARQGLSAAINTGWRALAADHDYLAWLGDDDVLEPGALEVTVRLLERFPQASMAYGACRFINGVGQQKFVSRPGHLEAGPLLSYGHNLISQPGTLFRRAAVDAVGGLDEGLRLTMDLDLFLRLRRWGPLVRTDRILASYRWHDGSLTVSDLAGSHAEAREVRRRQRDSHRFDGVRQVIGEGASRVVYHVNKHRPALVERWR